MMNSKIQLSHFPLKPSSILLGLAFLGIVIINGGCTPNPSQSRDPASDSASSIVEQDSQTLEVAVVRDFADKVVIPTYQELVKHAEHLSTAVSAFVKNPTEDTLKSAQEAWLMTRTPWEQSEAFAFGPASSLGYDGDLDDWPVNETDVVAILQNKAEINPETIKSLQTTQKGFHTIEYLLFGVNNDKQASDFTPQELQLLQQLTIAFEQTAQDLTQSWAKGVNTNPPYQQVLATAGETNNPAYPTIQAGIEEIVQGIIGCLDEVANEKIGEPLRTKENIGFESRFSHSSLDDFKNNLKSVENAYLGKFPQAETQGTSVSDLIAQTQPDLDQQVKQELQTAMDALNAIPNPIETQLSNPDAIAKMTTAQESILTLFGTFKEDVLPVVQGTKN